MNFFNNPMGAVAPTVTGLIVAATQSFADAFATAAAVLVVGIIFYVFVLGKIEPIDEGYSSAAIAKSGPTVRN